MTELPLKDEFYRINGLCMEVHKNLGPGLLEVVYKDALEYELRTNKIDFCREKVFDVKYKDIVLEHKFYADFVVMESIILEVKALNKIIDEHVKQTLNYLALSKCKVALIANFGNSSYDFKRLVY